MIRAGRMDQRVTFQSKAVTRNSIGEEVVTWGDFATVWAEIVPIRGKEFFAAAQMQQTVDLRMRIRNLSGLTGDMRAMWLGDPYDIVSVIPGTAQYAGITEVLLLKGARNG